MGSFFTKNALASWGARLALLALGGCVESYVPEVAAPTTSYLVVDGFINGNGATRIRLSRTVALATTTVPPAERGAKLFIFDDQGVRYALTEKSAGFYQSDSLLLSAARQYQLHITTAGSGAANYASDLVPLKVTPAIDKLNWQLDGANVRILLSTHDATSQSRYYRWGVVETWEFHSAFETPLEYDPQRHDVVLRETPIFTCWHTELSSLIRQGSSAQLSQDALTDVQLVVIPNTAEELKIRYSVLVSEYVETAPEFAYNEQLRKNTEAVGTVNDPLPSQLTGNVHRVGNSELVLGYVGAHTAQQQRLFINRADLSFPPTWQFDSPYRACALDTIDPSDPGFVPVSHSTTPPAYLGASRTCVDCRVRGSNLKPSFW